MNSLRRATMSVAFLFSIAVMGIAIVPCIELVAVRSGIAAVWFFNQLSILSTSEWIALAASFVIVVLLAKIAHTLSKINIALDRATVPTVEPTSPESGKFPVSTLEIAPRLAVKRSPKLDMVIDWLAANPDTKLSNREIARLLGVSHTIVNQGQKAKGDS